MLTQAFISQPTPPTTIPPGAYYWSRVAGPPAYLYPTTTTDTVRVDQGSVTNPSYGFLNTAAALLTGMYYAAANTIGFTSNGTQVGTFSTSSILFLGVTGAASTAGSSFGVATGTGGTGGADGGAFTAQTGTGSANAASAGGAGGAFTFTAGDGAAQSVAFTGGTGGTITAITGLGGANTGGASGANGGAGGQWQLSTGTGGATNSTNANKTGGAGGRIILTTGAGGAATGASTAATGGSGGALTFTVGNGGSSTTGVGGSGGSFTVAAGSGAIGPAGGGSGGGFSFSAGSGGSASSAGTNGGTGGGFTVNLGSGGLAGTGGTAGAGGQAFVSAGNGANQSNSTTGGTGGLAFYSAGAGGTNNSTGNGGVGGALLVAAGSGGSQSGGAATGSGGAGGAATLRTGAGSASNSTGTGVGGAGGALTIWAREGGNQSGANSTGAAGAGGGITVTSGDGGSATGGSSTGNGGAAGSLTLTPGVGGTSVGGTAGAQGRVKIAGSGIFAYANAQSITPSATHTLILTATAGANQSVVASTFIKIASDAAGRQIVLPPEASSNGLLLVFANTSGANTMVLRDSTNATTIATVAVSSQQAVMCDGTTWYPIAANSTPVTNYWQRTGTVLTPATAGDDVSSPRAAAGSFNEVFGAGAGFPSGTAAGNTILGNSATIVTPSSIYGVVIGYQASITTTGTGGGNGTANNTVIGYQALVQVDGSIGSSIGQNIAIGAGCQIGSAGGYHITVVGAQAGVGGAACIGATVIGWGATIPTANCYYSTCVGSSASSQSAYCTAIGSASGVSTSSGYSVVLGYAATAGADSVIALGAGAQCSTANRCLIGGGAVGGTSGNITSIVVGNGETNATPVGFSMMPTQASGSDKNGSDFTVRGGRNTGAGAGGQFLIDIYPAGASSSTGGTATNMQRVVSTYYNERRAGSGTGFANIAGGLFAAYTDSASSGTSAQNLHSFTLIGNTLVHDGDSLVFDTAMLLDTLGGNLTIQCRLGTTDLTLFNAAAPAGATQANYRVTITRTGAATQRVKGELIIQATTNVTAAVYSTMAETLSGNLTLANRITATVSGTITNQLSTVLYQPIPQT